MNEPDLDNPYSSAFSQAARNALTEHYETGANLYKFWGSPGSVLSALLLGWAQSKHPGHLSYAWDLESARSLDEGIRATTKQAVLRLGLEGNPAPRIFEAGCGIGGCTLEVAALFPRGQVTGLAIVMGQLEIARERARARNIGNARFVCGNYLRTPFPDRYFDAIFAMECIVHTPVQERSRLLQEWCRILKPGGRMVIFDGFSMQRPANEAQRKAIQDVMEGWTLPYPPSPGVFRSQAEASALRVVEQSNTTAHVYESARRIAAIGTWVLRPLSWLARVPLLGGLARPLGFESARHAALFVRACRAQQRVFEQNLGAYFVHVFERMT
ncbi:MAG: class I SAM-dependent methyltransferase [Betaproteobacteria bacterium]|nr:class I SAM-dependent methyltransferase [Betaproteobacteria bacterium]